MNNWVILAALLGVALLATVLVIGMGGSKLGPLPEELLPTEIPGFELVSRFDHVEPIFAGEEYSSLISFAPAEGSEFSGKVERMGITAYVFQTRQDARATGELLLGSTYSEAQKVELDGRSASSFADGGAGQAGLIWQAGPILYEAFVTAPGGDETDLEALHRAALLGARAVLQLWEAR